MTTASSLTWDIKWDGVPVFGFDFAEILAEGIEVGMEELEFLVTEGSYCDACGEYRILYDTDFDEIGGEADEHRLMRYKLCMQCREEMRDKIN